MGIRHVLSISIVFSWLVHGLILLWLPGGEFSTRRHSGGKVRVHIIEGDPAGVPHSQQQVQSLPSSQPEARRFEKSQPDSRLKRFGDGIAGSVAAKAKTFKSPSPSFKGRLASVTDDSIRPQGGGRSDRTPAQGAGYGPSTPTTPRDSADSAGHGRADLSTPAEMVVGSFHHPRYTREAIRAGYEADVIVQMLIDATGRVEDVRFASPVLYGMERRLEAALRLARFVPARNSAGQPVRGWASIRFRLQISG